MTPQHRILHDVLNLPTAPFVERFVIQYIREFVARRPALDLQADRFGNLLVTYAPGATRRGKRGPTPRAAAKRPLLFAAHMDHPGFCATAMRDTRHVVADWRGWVMASYFDKAKVRFFSGGRWVPGRIVGVIAEESKTTGRRSNRVAAGGRKASGGRTPAGARNAAHENPPKSVIARVAEPVEPGSPGMWDLPDAHVRDNRLYSRVCDDLTGLAGILCMLDAICRKPIQTTTYAFFTRAEEVGFAGALAAVADKTVPREAVVVAVENSKAITGVALGAGPVLRVGDRASVFTPAATAYCQVAAEELAAKDKSFVYQRKLMDGGTCESTAYCHYGYDATGICLALGNYHNMDAERGRIGPEYVDIRDFDNLVKWFVALAARPAKEPFSGAQPGLDKRLDGLLKEHRPRLLATAKTL